MPIEGNEEQNTAVDALAEIGADAAEFSEWVAQARAGARCVYFRGRITVDPGGKTMKAVAWAAYLAGAVDLTQRPRPSGGFDYVARRRRRPWKG